MSTIENAVQFGAPVLLENVGEELDPTLEPLLQKLTFKQGGVVCIRLGDNTVEYSEHFRFYITTKLRNPHYLPEVAVKVTLLNFMITPAGLQDQLLVSVVLEERPELAKEKEQLLVEGAEMAAQLQKCENDILHVLSTSEGNILEDAAAITALNNSKEISAEIKEKQQIALETEKNIDEVRAQYVPVAFEGQVMYFCIADLVQIEPTYQYALRWFTQLFVTSIRKSEKPDRTVENALEARIHNINHHFMYALYCHICRSLLEKDKLLFSFSLTTRLMQAHGKIPKSEFYFLLTGGVAVDNPYANPNNTWISEKMWGEICRVSTCTTSFHGFKESIENHHVTWKELYDSSTAHTHTLPLLNGVNWDTKLNGLQKLLILRCFRPDKLILALQNFVIDEMGEKYVKPPTFDLVGCFNDSTNSSPLVFVLSAGSDPMAALLKFSEDKSARVESISLGQGQGPKAEAMIKKAQKQGSWVVLQNCHLCISWMPTLEKIVEDTDGKRCHKGYRLWCTTYPSPDFPSAILQNAVKMTIEPPSGLRANMLGSYMADPLSDSEFFNSVEKSEEWHKFLFALCFFHALIQERREFGSLGWNNPYEFNDSDLRISIQQLAMFLDLYGEIPYKALNYCVGQCNYGGRVTDDKDRRCLVTILKRFFAPSTLEPNCKLSPDGSFQIPEEGDYQSYVDYIDQLPMVVHPKVFGFHENASITKDQSATNLIMSSMLATNRDAGGGDDDDGSEGADSKKQGGAANVEKNKPKTQDELTYEVAESNLVKIPQQYDMELAALRYPVDFSESMNTVLCQELERFNGLTSVIQRSLKDVMDAIRGIIVMSQELENVASSLFFGLVPSMWMDASYPSLKPLASYVNDFLQRLDFLEQWLNGQAPPNYWISGFFFTQAFLTGTLQNFARKYKIPIDHVVYDFEIMTKEHTYYATKPDDGAYIYGLFFDGARWEATQKVLTDAQPKILFSDAPVVWLKPTDRSKVTKYPHYTCPVYKTSERRGMLSTTGASTNYVMNIRIPADRPEDYWIEAGVAMLTQLDN